MLTEKQLEAIQTPFPPESLSVDDSRGFALTSIKAAYVIERLKVVFGTVGVGWRYVHSPFQEVQTDNGRVEIVTEVAFQYRYKASNDVAAVTGSYGMPRLATGTTVTPTATGASRSLRLEGSRLAKAALPSPMRGRALQPMG